jgi:hypothetical protein
VAVVFNNNKDKDDEQTAGQPQVTNPGAIANVTASSPAAASPSTAPAKGTSSGQFTNLKSYINANQNFNQQGGGLAGKVADNLNTQGQQVKQQVQGAVDTFKNKANEQVNQFQQGAQAAQQAVVNPAAAIQNQNLVNQVTQARDAQYTGPKTLLDLQGTQNQAALQANAQNFTQTVDQGKTEAGRFNLLRTMFGKPTYNSGQQNLDNLLIQGQKDQLQRINDTSRVSADVNRNLNRGIQDATNQGQQAIQTAEQIKQQTRDALNNRVLQEQQTIEQQLQQAQLEQNKALYRLASGLKKGYISDEDAQRFGLTGGQKIYNTDLTSLIGRGGDPTAQTVAKEDNYAQIAALNQLIGGAATEDASKVLSGFTDSSQAGKFDPRAYNLDKNALDINSAAREAQLKGGVKSAMDNFYEMVAGFNDTSVDEVKDWNWSGERKFMQDISDKGVDQAFVDMIKSRYSTPNAPDIKGLTDAQILAKFTDRPASQSGSTYLYEQARKLQNDLGVLNRLQVLPSGDGAMIDDYDQVDPRTGMTRGEQLLRSLGLLK